MYLVCTCQRFLPFLSIPIIEKFSALLITVHHSTITGFAVEEGMLVDAVEEGMSVDSLDDAWAIC